MNFIIRIFQVGHVKTNEINKEFIKTCSPIFLCQCRQNRIEKASAFTLCCFWCLVSFVPVYAAQYNASDFTYAKSKLHTVDWEAAVASMRKLSHNAPEMGEHHVLVSGKYNPLSYLNSALGTSFPWVSKTGVPVVLPFDTGAFLRQQTPPAAEKTLTPFFKAGISEIGIIDFGSTGYDMWLVAQYNGHPKVVTILASVLLYEVADLHKTFKIRTLQSGASKLQVIEGIAEGQYRIAVKRFGIIYVLSTTCAKSFPCDDARALLTKIATSLELIGGTPPTAAVETKSGSVPRPTERGREDFKFYPPGDLIKGSGPGQREGHVYASFRFPIKAGPAYANSQVFNDGGNCLQATLNLNGDVEGQPFIANGSSYHCRLSDEHLVNDEGSSRNYQYPWRDNFCEQREWSIDVCPGGKGHEGQDIRPQSCELSPWKANDNAPEVGRCKPNQHEVAAVDDGVISRSSGASVLHLYVNDHQNRYQVRYLHMLPSLLDAYGMTDGRMVKRGEVLGRVGNFMDTPFGTTSHLHFEMLVPTAIGWLHVNPYPSLITAYEWLIGERGTEIRR